MDIIALFLCHLQPFDFPNSFLLTSTYSWERLFNNYNIRQRKFVTVIVILQFLNRHLVQVVAQDCVVEIQEFAKVSMHNESSVVYSEL